MRKEPVEKLVESVEKFAGVGLLNLIAIWLMIMVLTVMAKVVVAKYPIAGISDIILAV